MQCDGQLYHAKSRAEMATGSRHCFYEPPTHLHGQLWQLAFGQCLHIARSADRGNQVPASVANRGCHCARTYLGRPNRTVSVAIERSTMVIEAYPRSASITCPTSRGGAEAPAVTPIVETDDSHSGSMSSGPSIK